LSLIAPILVAAFLESFLWVGAFLYCFAKAFMKANHWSVRVLAVLFSILHIVMKGVFLPIMVVTLPLPRQIVQYFPEVLTGALRYVAFYSFAGMLIVPWLVCLYRVIVYPVGRHKRVRGSLNERTAPKVMVVMPVYKEPPDILWTALNSVVHCDYPAACIHVFLSFDGDDIDELYLKTIERLGVPITLKEFPKSIDVTYSGARVTVSRFPHGGKRQCQKWTFLLIDKIYKRYMEFKDDLFILFIDSDCILDPVCIQNFMYDMELRPGNKRDMLAMTGIITCRTDKHSFLTLLQDTEYLHGQLFERSVEAGCGAVSCLPGALTLLRFSAFRNVARFYFSDKAEQCDDIFDYAKQVLGEDRWLTHLFMLGACKPYLIQLSTSAFCKTEAVQTFRALLKQRRRWFLGFMTNEVCMLTDARLWKQYPLLLLLRLTTLTVRTTSMLLLITLVAVATTSQEAAVLPWEFMLMSLGLGWVMMFYFAIKLHRWKALLYPLMWFCIPFFNWIFMVYGIFTAGQRTWGGPRADAGAADSNITAQQAIEHARDTGDDLNVVPETFRPAAQTRKRHTRPSALQPSASVEGRFVSAEPGSTESFLLERGLEEGSEPSRRRRRYDHGSLDMSDTDMSIHTPKML
jgi:chitin synthase